MSHAYRRTERELRELAAGFTAGVVDPATLPLRLEMIAALLRVSIEANKALDGKPHDYDGAARAATEARHRLNEIERG